MAEPERRDDQDVAERQARESDADDQAADDQAAEEQPDPDEPADASQPANPEDDPDSDDTSDEVGQSEGTDADSDASDGDDAEADAESDVEDAEAEGVTDDADLDAEADDEAHERLHPDTLIARYRLLGGPTGYLLPWSWSDLPPAETGALVEVVDGFVESYNNLWALTEADTVPPCWHHHQALAHDLAALAWAYFQAYRDPGGTPDLALRFQAHLPGFRERMDYWLGADPAACREGRHTRSWRASTTPAAPSPRDSSEEQDAVILLGADDLGFPRAPAPDAPEE